MSSQYGGIPSNISNSGFVVGIQSSTNTNPSVITTLVPHGLTDQQKVDVFGHQLNTAVNGIWTATVLSPTTFSVPVAGSGVGVTTGDVASLALGATAQLPSDGDDEDGASVDVMLERLSDQTAYLAAATGSVKLANLFQFTHSGASQQTTWFTTPISNGSGFIDLSPTFTAMGGIVKGDYLEIDFTGTLQVAPDVSSGGTVEASIGAIIQAPGTGGSPAKLTGSGQTIDVPTGANGPMSRVTLRGQMKNVSTTGTLVVAVGGTGDLATANTVNVFGIGDWCLTVRVWRITGQLQ